MTAPRWSRRRLLVEIRRIQGVLSRADVHFSKSRGWSSAEVDRTRLQLRALELMVVGERVVAKASMSDETQNYSLRKRNTELRTRNDGRGTRRSASACKASA